MSTTSMNVAGGRGLPVPTKPVTHATTRREPWRPAYWSQPSTPQAPEVPPPAPRPRRKPAPRGPRATSRLSPQELAQACADYRAGTAPLDTLARRYHRSWQTIKAELERAGVVIRAQGGVHHRGELTDEQLSWAVEQYGNNHSARSIAEVLPVHRERLVVLLKEAGVEVRTGRPKKPLQPMTEQTW